MFRVGGLLLSLRGRCRVRPQWARRNFSLSDLQKIVRLARRENFLPTQTDRGDRFMPDWKTDKAQMEIDIVDAANGARRAVTWKRTGIASPKWSEDGRGWRFWPRIPHPRRRRIPAPTRIPKTMRQGFGGEAGADIRDAD